jgi:hypothetical protein
MIPFVMPKSETTVTEATIAMVCLFTFYVVVIYAYCISTKLGSKQRFFIFCYKTSTAVKTQ